MPIHQKPGGEHTTDPPTATVKYQYFREKDPLPTGDFWDWVTSLALSQIPTTYAHPTGALLIRKDMRVVEHTCGYDYEITVPYGLKDGTDEPDESGAYEITVDQVGGTVHVIAGELVSVWDENGQLPNEDGDDGLIGVDGDEVHGTDLPKEETRLNVRFRHPQAQLNRAYIKATGKLVGYPNKDEFLGYEPYEVLYLGGNFTESSDSDTTAQYSFAISYNEDDVKIGSVTVPHKKGWELLSVKQKDETSPNGVPIKKIDNVQVIRHPGGRKAKDYVPVFGWGGS